MPTPASPQCDLNCFIRHQTTSAAFRDFQKVSTLLFSGRRASSLEVLLSYYQHWKGVVVMVVMEPVRYGGACKMRRDAEKKLETIPDVNQGQDEIPSPETVTLNKMWLLYMYICSLLNEQMSCKIASGQQRHGLSCMQDCCGAQVIHNYIFASEDNDHAMVWLTGQSSQHCSTDDQTLLQGSEHRSDTSDTTKGKSIAGVANVAIL